MGDDINDVHDIKFSLQAAATRRLFSTESTSAGCALTAFW